MRVSTVKFFFDFFLEHLINRYIVVTCVKAEAGGEKAGRQAAVQVRDFTLR